MAINPSRGFTLFIALVFMLVITAIGTVVASFVFKQAQLASTATQSQYSFYAADAAIECALEGDASVPSIFDYSTPGSLSCGGALYSVQTVCLDGAGTKTDCAVGYRETQVSSINLDNPGNYTRCADVTVYKPQGLGKTYIFAQGYNLPCASVSTNPNTVARGLEAIY